MNDRGSLGEMTLGDIAKGFKRYQPFILTVAAIVLLVAFVGHPAGSHTATSTGPGGGSVSLGNGNGSGAAGSGGGTQGTGSTGGNGSSSAGGTSLSTGGTGTTGGGVSSLQNAGRGSGTGGLGSTSGTGTGTLPSSGLGGGTQTTAATDPYCDPNTGRVEIPTLYAPSCVPPYSGNNGGATYNGVSGNSITVAVPLSSDQAQAQAVAAAANDNDTDAQVRQVAQDYVTEFEHHVQTYGRQVKLVYFTSNYNSNDSTDAQNSECQADATYVAKTLHAFMTWDQRAEECGTVAYQNTLAHDGVLCFCTTTVPSSYYLQWAPYVWGSGLPDETQGYLMRTEVICKELASYAPKFAGESDLNSPVVSKRVFGLIWPGASTLDNTTVYESGANYFAQQLQQKCGIVLKDKVSFPIVDTNGPADAQTLMAKFKSDHVTTVILVADPIDPIYLTTAATKQLYFPEWFDTGSALTDETHYGRLYDQNQWKHAFGFSALPDRVPNTLGDAYSMYNWAYHGAPPAAYTFPTEYLWALEFFSGISLAGPDLTPYTYQCGEAPYTSTTHSGPLGAAGGVPCVGKVYPGLFGYPISPSDYPQRVANAVVSFGSKLWPWDDYNVFDDGTLIWWDGTATGPDETNSNGVGMWRYLYNGKRYLLGQFPSGQQPWFDSTNTVTVFGSLPGPDKPPSYPYKACYYMCA